jgi:thiol-disulfide isomerase/thioredoxin
LLIVAVLALGAGWIWLTRVPAPVALAPARPLPLVGRPAPDFTLPRPGGDELTLAELRGKAVVLNFWASWCGPCEAEMPELQEAARKFGDKGLVVVGVNQGEPAEIVVDYLARLGITFPIALDTAVKVSATYRVNSLPTTFFIDRDGILRDQVIGQMNTAVLQQRLRSIYP